MLPEIGTICLFCQTDLKAMDLFTKDDKYIHYHCPKKCCKVMTLQSGDWILFRIRFDNDSSVEIDKRVGKFFIYQDYNKAIYFCLPLFDIRPYSLLELKNKIKKYIVFS